MENYHIGYPIISKKGGIKILLEIGEFIREKDTRKVVWIEKINKYDNTIEIGKMDGVIINGKIIYNKEFELVSRKDFYNRYIDL